ncbi:MerC family mercury resistance protein [Fodinicurvata sp. EGI_FJ10296]|uniref:MerC family mercury resistance protein n=1 Tax=Fodinicurvata sp. EGI_FJ10296 TaxID=3231908 RepID=UPI003454017A
MVAILGFSKPQITAAIRQMYSEVASRPGNPFHFPVGRKACLAVGYPVAVLDDISASAVDAFAGVGYPHAAAVIGPGQTVLDLGAGSGTDTLIASRAVGASGRVIAMDITPGMLARLRSTIEAGNVANIETVVGDAERIPLPDASVDVVTSNGALNLVPGKKEAVAELRRVLKPGGWVQLSDIVIKRPVPVGGRGDPKLWAECVVGASVDDDYLALFEEAGFTDIEVLASRDYFAESASPDTRQIASTLGARSIDVRMQRPVSAGQPGWLARMAGRLHPSRLTRQLRAIGERGLWGAVATIAALAACYGTIALLPLLAMLGIGVSVNEGIWALTVAAGAIVAIAAIAWNATRHRSPYALILALPGGLAVVYSMLVAYHPATEAAGFAALIAAVGVDLYLLYRAELCR